MKIHQRKWAEIFFLGILIAVCPMAGKTEAQAAERAGSLSSVTGESLIFPMPDGSGKYFLKSDGFYCLKEDGSFDVTPSVHYFDHVSVGGTIFDGFYYHDESGRFKASSPQMVYLKGVKAVLTQEQAQSLMLQGAGTDESMAEASSAETGALPDTLRTRAGAAADVSGKAADTSGAERDSTYTINYDGYYMVGNLGRLNAAPQVRYINNLTFRGFYYFDETGKMDTEPGIHAVNMVCNGIRFDGSYYFGGEDGALLQEAVFTDTGYMTDENGKIQNPDESGTERLETALLAKLSEYEGTWSVYVKDLKEGGEILLNDTSFASASLIKTFVMAETYSDMQTVRENLAERLKTDSDSDAVTKRLDTLLENMIMYSDNESYNELVRLQTGAYSFSAGARKMNRYLEQNNFLETQVLHTLSPSKTTPTGIGESNTTSVKDCGLLLEQIYNGECVSEEASETMLDLLLGQNNRTKIPAGLPEEAISANKTGETDTSEHDIAIVYGEKTDFILCVMSENSPKGEDPVQIIREIADITYRYLNS